MSKPHLKVELQWHYAMDIRHLTCINFTITIGNGTSGVIFAHKLYNYSPLLSTPVANVSNELQEVINIMNTHVLKQYDIHIS